MLFSETEIPSTLIAAQLEQIGADFTDCHSRHRNSLGHRQCPDVLQRSGGELCNHDNRDQLPIGTRVRLLGEQYPAAIRCGTATIIDIVKQHQVDGTWEYLVRTDAGKVAEWNMVASALSSSVPQQ